MGRGQRRCVLEKSSLFFFGLLVWFVCGTHVQDDGEEVFGPVDTSSQRDVALGTTAHALLRDRQQQINTAVNEFNARQNPVESSQTLVETGAEAGSDVCPPFNPCTWRKSLMIPFYRQCDPRWAGWNLGQTSTICRMGDLITSLTMGLHAHGVMLCRDSFADAQCHDLTPIVLTDLLNRKGGFLGNELMWFTLELLSQGTIQIVHMHEPPSKSLIKDWLARQFVIIARVNHKIKAHDLFVPVDCHYVLLVGLRSLPYPHYVVNDPASWWGEAQPLPEEYITDVSALCIAPDAFLANSISLQGFGMGMMRHISLLPLRHTLSAQGNSSAVNHSFHLVFVWRFLLHSSMTFPICGAWTRLLHMAPILWMRVQYM
eukprot:TRINITY_DN2772_c0_g1_i1.p1 TRINITY_DN2772_c0_g1~~TRINITY_DN2772_c0_g1_i1.p1  ORF type:complete len:379 (-),score=37.91 TRINITY_DN2772_c0_g1_i1:34-1149(-)